MKNALSLIIGVFIMCGCVGPISYTDQQPAPAGQATKDWREIEVVHLNQIKKEYEIIGECRGDAWLDNTISLKKQAARLGADAISIPQPDGAGRIISQALKYK